MELTIIILNYNTKDLLEDCLNSIFNKSWVVKFTVWVVDNASTDGSVEMVKKKFSEVKILETGSNLGFAGGNNYALKQVKTKYSLLLNSDTLVLEGSLDNFVKFMEDGIGVGSCKLLNPDKSFQPNAGQLPFGSALFYWISGLDDLPLVGSLLPSFHQKNLAVLKKEGGIGWVSGTAMMIDKKVIEKIGLLDEKLFMYAEDTDYCIRAKKAGFKIGWTDKAEIIHLGGGSSKDASYKQWLGEFRGLLYLYKKYLGSFASYYLKLLLYVFILIRVCVFFIIGKTQISKTYAKIFITI